MINIIFVVFESVWRRAFGDDGFGLPIMKYRFFLHLINILVLYEYLFQIKGFSMLVAFYVAGIIQILFYTLSFYSGFDLGHSYPPTDKEIADYGIIGKLLKCVFPSTSWYKFWFDFTFMVIRYTWPLVLIVYWFNPLILLVGYFVAVGYSIGWERRPFGLTTEFGEYCMGAALAIGLIFC